jgi:XTP/dITP diphosphohydrolase
VLATANPDKATEVADILLGSLGDRVELVPRPGGVPEVDETGETLEENARLKAAALVEATGLSAVADDTGLEVTGIDGRPGVYSARYAGEGATYADNIAKLLSELAGTPEGSVGRRARFRTVALCRLADGSEVSAEGVVEGSILPAPRGEGGFGYDPVFAPDGGGGRSFAEMTPAEKHSISHRGRAFRALASALSATLGI